MRPTRIVWVISPLMARGGGFNILLGWIRHLPPERYDLSLVYFSHERGKVEAALAPWPHVKLVHVAAMRSPGSLYLPGIAALRRLFREMGPDVVHSVMVQGDILGSVAARMAHVPVVVSSAIGYLVPSHTARWKAAIYRAGVGLARRRIDRVLAISGATKRELVEDFGFRSDQVQVVFSGIELGTPARPRSGPRAESPVIGFVGELIPEKGAQHLVRAFPAILAACGGARLRLVGDGTFRPALEALVASLGVQERVEFAGWLPSGPRAMAEMDVFVFASEPGYDGLPRVLLESWSVGTPFVTTDVAVVPEIVHDGVDGLVVPPRDPSAMAAAVVRLLRDPPLWRRMAEVGLARAPEFAVEREVEVMRSVYAELLARAPGASPSAGREGVG